MTQPTWRWSYLLTRVVFGLLLVSIPASRILLSLSESEDGAFSGAVAGIAVIAVVVIVSVGLFVRFDANVTVRKVRDTLAPQHPDGAFLVQKTTRMQSDLRSLKPDLFGSGWSRWSTAMVVTVGDEAFTIWDHDHGRPLEVLSIPWASVRTVKIDRVGVGARWVDAVVARVHSGPIKIDLVFPPVTVRRGMLTPAELEQVQSMEGHFTKHLHTPEDQIG